MSGDANDEMLAGIKVKLRPIPGHDHLVHDLQNDLTWKIRSNFDYLLQYNKVQANDDGPVRESHKLGDEVRTAMNALAVSVAMSVVRAVIEDVLPKLHLTVDSVSDLSKLEFDVLERIWTATSEEMARRPRP